MLNKQNGAAFFLEISPHARCFGRRVGNGERMRVIAKDRLEEQRVLLHIKIEADRAGVRDIILLKPLPIFNFDLLTELRQNAAAECRQISESQMYGFLFQLQQGVYFFAEGGGAAQQLIAAKRV